jgi:hypothetical protein
VITEELVVYRWYIVAGELGRINCTYAKGKKIRTSYAPPCLQLVSIVT